MKKHTFLLGILLSSAFAVAGWLFDAGWLQPFTMFFAERSSQIPLLALAIIIAILALEYRTWFLCHSEQVSLLPTAWQRKKMLELAATSVLTVATIALFAQLIAKVYAMSFTLFSSSTEVTETNSVAVGDFDGDGDMDYIVGSMFPAGSGPILFYAND